MSTIADPATLARLEARLARLAPASPRRWGTLTPGELLAHLADASDSVLGRRVPPGLAPSGRPNPVIKWVALRSPLPWPRGAQTRAGVDPRREGTRPGDFEADRARVIAGLRDLAAAAAATLSPAHAMFGPMSRSDWHRWAYRHVDHHLRQFGL